jgi:uncharacterized protein
LKIDVSKLKNIKLAAENLLLSEKVDTVSYGYPELCPVSDFTFKGKIENLGDVMELEGTVKGSLELVCSRCLQPFVWDFDAEVFETYTNHPEIAAADEYEEINLFSGDEIDLLPQLLKQIFLEMPMKILCKPDCLGLCSRCGADLNHGDCGCERDDIDIRFADLKDLLNTMNKEV